MNYDFPYIGKSNPNWLSHVFFRGVGIPPTRRKYNEPCWILINCNLFFFASKHNAIGYDLMLRQFRQDEEVKEPI